MRELTATHCPVCNSSGSSTQLPPCLSLSVQPTPPPPMAPVPSSLEPAWWLSGLGIQNLSIIRAPSGAASGVPEHIKMPKSEAPPHPISGGLCLRLHFRSPDRKWAGGSASRHLKATSCFPAALCQPWGCAPWLHPQSLPRALSQQLRGDRMVDMIAKLTRRKSRLPQGQVGDPCIEGS